MDTDSFHAELAWLGGDAVAADVLIETEHGRITAVTPMSHPPPPHARRLPGLTIPGLVNTHSHVFHRAIRGRNQSGVADFWEWRDSMYRVAERLDPDLLYRLARATYTEMALAGITAVGEFHYLHHGPNGQRYAEANTMGMAITRAAHDAGLRITLIDTCYLQSDIDGSPSSGVQQRFDDGNWERWAARVDELESNSMTRIGAAIHSVRATPTEAFAPIRRYASRRGIPLHVHLSEQPAENEASIAVYGCTPTELLKKSGIWGEATTAVHATHLTDADIAILGSTRTSVSMCCTTERDLADGPGSAVRLAAAGSPICVGSDAHTVIDLFEEARAIELNERLLTGVRGNFRVEQLLTTLTKSGADSLGWNSGQIAPGSLADFVTVSLDTPRTAGARVGEPLSHVVFAATSADVSHVVVEGTTVVENGRHLTVARPGEMLESAIEAILD